MMVIEEARDDIEAEAMMIEEEAKLFESHSSHTGHPQTANPQPQTPNS